jgi:hypothetical protein|tara:strand:- start:450 stop:1088 length:639 start_codon:yes stop_codon:yes gene_type:complete
MDSNKRFKVGIEMPPLPALEGETELSLFDPTNPDLALLNLIDEEQIRLSGSKILYYKYFQSDGTIDPIYMEERSKVLHSQPLTVFGHYNPTAIEENLSQFGLELTSDQLFVFNKSSIETLLGRTPIPYDVVQPQFQNIKYQIIEVQEESFEIYGVYHLTCAAKILRDSELVMAEPLTKQSTPTSRRDIDPRLAESPLSTQREDLTNPYGDRQ